VSSHDMKRRGSNSNTTCEKRSLTVRGAFRSFGEAPIPIRHDFSTGTLLVGLGEERRRTGATLAMAKA
jgi:hypothetical protein